MRGPAIAMLVAKMSSMRESEALMAVTSQGAIEANAMSSEVAPSTKVQSVGTRGAGIVSEAEWNDGASQASDSAKAAKVVAFLGTLGRSGAKMPAIAKGTGLKWPYSTVKALQKAGAVEAKKVGKAMAYRLKAVAPAKAK